MAKVDEFKAIDIDRKVYTITHYKSSIPVSDLDGPSGQTIDGISSYNLVDGTP